MKIGVMTYCNCDNYGAELQAYALHHVLRDMGHDSEVIDFERVPITAKQKELLYKRAIFQRLRYGVMGAFDVVGLIVQMLLRKMIKRNSCVTESLTRGRDAFEAFWSDVPHTRKVQENELSLLQYDAYIAGSDQIWNWLKTGDLSAYFLSFVKHGKKIAYAASYSDNEMPSEYIEVYRKGLNNLDNISVREVDGKALLQPLTEKNIEVVLDPTLLRTSDWWASVWSDRIKVSEPYIFSYSLNTSSRYIEILRRYAKMQGLRIVNVTSSMSNLDYPEVFNVFDAGPREFLHLLAHAKVVFTNSFHGTIFSINFKKQFLSILNPASTTNSRILSITNLLGLSSRVVTDLNSVQALKVVDKKIDFELVHQRLEALKAKSLNYLREALK